MSVTEMRKVINAKIDAMDESKLKMVEQFIEKINSFQGAEKEWDLKKYVSEILEERAEVLQKLAQ